MPRARMIKPEFFDDEKLAKISRDARLVFPGLWIFSDDYGVVKGNHDWLLSKIFPYERDIKLSQFSGWLKELEAIDCIRSFSVDGESYYYISHFNDHQTINKPSQTRNPTPPDTLLHQCNTTTELLPSEREIEIEIKKKYKEKKKETPLPENFLISERNRKLLADEGFTDIDVYLPWFKDWATSKAKTYADWDAVFRNCVRGDWGQLRGKGNGSGGMPAQENTNCINHPGKPGTATKNGRWYCRMCLDRIDAPPGKFDKPLDKFEITVKDLATKLGMT